jgi:hypothetical protein
MRTISVTVWSASRVGRPRTLDVIAANSTSRVSPTAVPMSVAAIGPPTRTRRIPVSPARRRHRDAAHETRAHVSRPLEPGHAFRIPPRKQLRTPSIDAAPIIAASSGPKRTAAKRVGRSEIEYSQVVATRTLARSARAAVVASARSIQGGLQAGPCVDERDRGAHRGNNETDDIEIVCRCGARKMARSLNYPSNGIYDPHALSCQSRSQRRMLMGAKTW